MRQLQQLKQKEEKEEKEQEDSQLKLLLQRKAEKERVWQEGWKAESKRELTSAKEVCVGFPCRARTQCCQDDAQRCHDFVHFVRACHRFPSQE